MKIDVYTVPSEVIENETLSGTAVMIDVLRASSSMLYALRNGCREIFPVESIERALSLHSALFTTDVLLCGERYGVKINGFHLGNSPLEFSEEVVKGKSLIFTSTNGSVMLVKTRHCEETFIGGFQNISLLADTIAESVDHLNILCAGRENHFALEDVSCAGMLIDLIRKKRDVKVELTDAAAMALIVYRENAKNLKAMVRKADHGKFLISIGREKDLDICVEVDSIPLLPYYIEGKVGLSNTRTDNIGLT